VLRARSVPLSPHNSTVLETKAHLGPNLGLGSASPFMGKNIKLHLGLKEFSSACDLIVRSVQKEFLYLT